MKPHGTAYGTSTFYYILMYILRVKAYEIISNVWDETGNASDVLISRSTAICGKTTTAMRAVRPIKNIRNVCQFVPNETRRYTSYARHEYKQKSLQNSCYTQETNEMSLSRQISISRVFFIRPESSDISREIFV